jgi:hypothetical protein
MSQHFPSITLRHLFASAGLVAAGLITTPALAGSHTWDIIEVFSNADGSIQYIELAEQNGGSGELFLSGHTVSSESTGKVFTFPANLTGSSSFKHLLLATTEFAALPGAPTPDYTISEGFFNPAGDTLHYHVYDTWAFGAIPTDCMNSFNRVGGIAANTPENYASVIGSVDCSAPAGCASDITGPGGLGTPDGNVDSLDFLALIGQWGSPCTGSCEADITGPTPNVADGNVDSLDFLLLISQWGSPGNCP